MKQYIIKIIFTLGIFLIGFILGVIYQYNYDHNYNEKIITKMQSEYSRLKDKYSSLNKLVTPLKKIAGLTDIQGEGIIIIIDKNKRYAKQTHPNEKELGQLLNELWISGAKAIAINGTRININTKLTTKGTTLFLNQTAISRPLRINVLGNKNDLQTSLTTKNNVLNTLKEKRIKTTIYKGSNIIIPQDKSLFIGKDIKNSDLN